MGNVKRHLNLLPWQLRCKMMLRDRLRQWSACWAMLVVATAAIFGWKCFELGAVTKELGLWQRRAVAIQSIDDDNLKLRRQIAGHKERLEKYGHLESEQIGYQLIATLSQCSSTGGPNIQVQKLAFKHALIPETTTATTAAAAGTKPLAMRDIRKLMLSGAATNNLAVAQFVSSLRDSGAFQAVDLKSSHGNRTTDTGSRMYNVECSF